MQNFYTLEDVFKAGYNLEPLKCKHCASHEVVFLQGIKDAKCQNCGEWQNDEGL